ncbi:MAG TPA: hypothetical protein VHJ82_09270 [Actinomycetota bacterium]|nr:hypothetical protein [Actinomycetota bacterium]
MIRLRLALLVCLALTAGCRSDEVTLIYRFQPGGTTEYLMRADARARWDIGGGGQGRSNLEIRVLETVEEIDGDDATLEVTMIPQAATGSGLLAPGAERRTFRLRVGADGGVREVLDINGIPARVLQPQERTLIGTFRVPLPESSVGLLDTWTASLGVGGEVGLGGSLLEGRLVRLNNEAGRDTAHLRYSGSGPLSWTVSLPQGDAALEGDALTDVSATFDIAGGFLRAAESTTSATFDLRVERSQVEAPIRGTLSFVLDIAVERVSGAP